MLETYDMNLIFQKILKCSETDPVQFSIDHKFDISAHRLCQYPKTQKFSIEISNHNENL